MEEDIKILKEQLNTYKRHLENYEKEDCLTSVYYELKKYATALKNLIKGYRELEHENKYLKEHIAMLICLEQENIDLNNKLNKLKSKIKEIFDRLNISDIEPWSTYKVNGKILFDLQQLVEDK